MRPIRRAINQCGAHSGWKCSRFPEGPGTFPSENVADTGESKIALEEDKEVSMGSEREWLSQEVTEDQQYEKRDGLEEVQIDLWRSRDRYRSGIDAGMGPIIEGLKYHRKKLQIVEGEMVAVMRQPNFHKIGVNNLLKRSQEHMIQLGEEGSLTSLQGRGHEL